MKLIVNGAGGRMGTVLRKRIGEIGGMELTGAVDRTVKDPGLLTSLYEVAGRADCIIDFSNHAGTCELLEFALERRIPAVIATTGQTEEELAMIRTSSERIPVFRAENLSLGIALLSGLVRKAAAMLPGADVEIVECHHNGKLDVPSGTALMLAQAVQTVHTAAGTVVGRHTHGVRDRQEIGIHSLRMGNAIGTHEVILSTGAECITLRHEVQERSLYAEGALEAAAFLIRQPPGLYRMEDLLRERGIEA